MGPIMLDVLGTSLTQEDKELLQHPLVGGLILFTRNFESVAQISALVADIRQVAHQDFLIAVDSIFLIAIEYHIMYGYNQ